MKRIDLVCALVLAVSVVLPAQDASADRRHQRGHHQRGHQHRGQIAFGLHLGSAFRGPQPCCGVYYRYPYRSLYYGSGVYPGTYEYLDYSRRDNELERRARRAMGAVELRIKPKNAQVYVDGRYLGRAKRFDGRPGFLWLKRGTHELALYRDGYRTLAFEIRVLPGRLLEIRQRMPEGRALHPDELSRRWSGERHGPYTDKDRDREWERRRDRHRDRDSDDEWDRK